LKAHPELADNKTFRALQMDAVDYFKEVHGMSEQQIGALWNGNRDFRSAAGQAMTYAAVKQWRGEKAAKELRAKQLPPVRPQRPGVAGYSASRTADIEGLSNRLAGATGNKALRIATELLKARRAAR
jgi:hypothetical protein